MAQYSRIIFVALYHNKNLTMYKKSVIKVIKLCSLISTVTASGADYRKKKLRTVCRHIYTVKNKTKLPPGAGIPF
jgi:hypothetical protein